MIPTRDQCLLLFDRFQLPSQKRIHVEEVTRLAMYLAKKIIDTKETLRPGSGINLKLLEAATLLHDIDKNILKREGERHPDTGVRVLKELGYEEVAEVVSRHSLHHLLSPHTAPRTWEEKLLYLADKMTKYEIIGVEHRFALWYKENLPQEAVVQLDAALPKVKALEQEVYQLAGITFEDIKKDLINRKET